MFFQGMTDVVSFSKGVDRNDEFVIRVMVSMLGKPTSPLDSCIRCILTRAYDSAISDSCNRILRIGVYATLLTGMANRLL